MVHKNQNLADEILCEDLLYNHKSDVRETLLSEIGLFCENIAF